MHVRSAARHRLPLVGVDQPVVPKLPATAVLAWSPKSDDFPRLYIQFWTRYSGERLHLLVQALAIEPKQPSPSLSSHLVQTERIDPKGLVLCFNKQEEEEEETSILILCSILQMRPAHQTLHLTVCLSDSITMIMIATAGHV